MRVSLATWVIIRTIFLSIFGVESQTGTAFCINIVELKVTCIW